MSAITRDESLQRVRVQSIYAPVAQWIEQPPPKGQVGRSIRLWGATFQERSVPLWCPLRTQCKCNAAGGGGLRRVYAPQPHGIRQSKRALPGAARRDISPDQRPSA